MLDLSCFNFTVEHFDACEKAHGSRKVDNEKEIRGMKTLMQDWTTKKAKPSSSATETQGQYDSDRDMDLDVDLDAE